MPDPQYPAPWAGELYRQSKKNAKARNIPFNLTKEEFSGIVIRSEGRCELTGICFQTLLSASAMQMKRRPYYPSLDRIDSSRGYDGKNCRLVCSAVNMALNVWGEEVFRRIAMGLLGHDEADPMPSGIRVRKAKNGYRYSVRLRQRGREKSLGSFRTLGEAMTALSMKASPKITPKD